MESNGKATPKQRVGAKACKEYNRWRPSPPQEEEYRRFGKKSARPSRKPTGSMDQREHPAQLRADYLSTGKKPHLLPGEKDQAEKGDAHPDYNVVYLFQGVKKNI